MGLKPEAGLLLEELSAVSCFSWRLGVLLLLALTLQQANIELEI